MGIELEVFYLYKITSHENKEIHILIRCTRKEFQNHSQTQEDEATKIIESKKDSLLENYIFQHLKTNIEHIKIDFLGEMQVDTFGDELFENVHKELAIYVADTQYKFPWIAIGQADSEADFVKKMNDDEIYDTELGILSLHPKIETLRKLKVQLITDQSS